MAQLNHELDMPIARAGMLGDTGHTETGFSRLIEDAAGAGAGTFLVPGTDAEKQAVAPTSATQITDGDGLGVVRYDASKEPARVPAALAAGNEFDPEQMAYLKATGKIWVRCDDGATIVANTPAFVRFASGAGGSVLGRFRQDADTATAAALPNAVFRSVHKDVKLHGEATASQRIALVQLNLPSV